MHDVSSELLSNIIYSTGFLVWDDLKERFDKANGSRIYQLHREISITQQGVDSVTVYFNKLRLLWDEFEAICNLPKCDCDQFKHHIEHANNIKLFKFLMGLNENYYNVHSNFLMRVPLPTLNETYSVLIQEENQRSFAGHSTIGPVLDYSFSDTSSFFSSNISLSSNNSFRNGLSGNIKRIWTCQHCKRKGNINKLCWILHPELRG